MNRVPGNYDHVILLTGVREAGKTSLLLEVLEECHTKRIDSAGVLSPAVFEDGKKIAIDLLNVRNGERRRLADLRSNQSAEIMTDHWVFDPDVLEWGNSILDGATPCDLLIVDELGPIEFERGLGMQNGIKSVSAGKYLAALVVIRPELIEKAGQLWPGSIIYTVSNQTESSDRKLLEAINPLIHPQ
jgi:nucleoside-triphosphatase THEP1